MTIQGKHPSDVGASADDRHLPLDDDDPRREAWRLFIEATARLFTALDEQLRRDSQMTLSDYHVMLLLSEAPERRMRMKDLSRKMAFSASRLSYQVDVMCRRGWLCREAAAEDRRGSYAALTEAGQSAFVSAAAGHSEIVHDLFFNVLSVDSGSAMAAMMRDLTARLDEYENV